MFAVTTVDNSFLYDLLFLGHILCAIIGFGATFVVAILAATRRRIPGSEHGLSSQLLVETEQRLITPFTILTGVFGILLILASDELFEFSDAWISIAFVLFFAYVGIHLGVVRPKARQLLELDRSGGPAAERDTLATQVSMFGGINHLVFLLLLIDMIWKPGWP